MFGQPRRAYWSGFCTSISCPDLTCRKSVGLCCSWSTSPRSAETISDVVLNLNTLNSIFNQSLVLFANLEVPTKWISSICIDVRIILAVLLSLSARGMCATWKLALDWIVSFFFLGETKYF